MLKLISRLLILFLLLFAGDRLIGMALEKLFYKQVHGDAYVTRYVLEEAKADVLVFGSSRASHHYIADTIARYTGMTCYNAGRDEMTITYSNAVLPVIYGRYNPKVIVLEVLPSEIRQDPGNEVVYQRISTTLLPFARRYPSFLPTIAKAGSTELLKVRVSKIYPYNSLFASMLQNTYTHFGHASINGYEPLYAKIDTHTYKEPMWAGVNENAPVDTQLSQTLVDLVQTVRAHNARLMVVISPFYFPIEVGRNDSYHEIRKITTELGAEFYDFSHDTDFLRKPHLFNDDVHLNDDGAKIFSRKVARLINRDTL